MMASPTWTTAMRLKFAPQRGHRLASAEIIAPHALHEVILAMTQPPPPVLSSVGKRRNKGKRGEAKRALIHLRREVHVGGALLAFRAGWHQVVRPLTVKRDGSSHLEP
jgi:hypothetical protein